VSLAEIIAIVCVILECRDSVVGKVIVRCRAACSVCSAAQVEHVAIEVRATLKLAVDVAVLTLSVTTADSGAVWWQIVSSDVRSCRQRRLL